MAPSMQLIARWCSTTMSPSGVERGSNGGRTEVAQRKNHGGVCHASPKTKEKEPQRGTSLARLAAPAFFFIFACFFIFLHFGAFFFIFLFSGAQNLFFRLELKQKIHFSSRLGGTGSQGFPARFREAWGMGRMCCQVASHRGERRELDRCASRPSDVHRKQRVLLGVCNLHARRAQSIKW